MKTRVYLSYHDITYSLLLFYHLNLKPRLRYDITVWLCYKRGFSFKK